jgi:hypothetical protein
MAPQLVGEDEFAGTIVKITSAGVKSTYATGFFHPAALALNATGTLFVSSMNSSTTTTIYQVHPTGASSLFATASNGILSMRWL